ncbi:MAG: hypothetical protein V3U54_04890 [Thermodesulfobacteriota bacterium]
MGYLRLDLFPRRKFNKQTFDKYYTEYEQYLFTNKPVKYQIVAPLENFDCASNSSVIKLSSYVRIVPANSTFYPDIISENLNKWMNELCPEVEYWTPPKFFLEIDCEMERNKVPSKCKERIEDDMIKSVREVFRILRLYKEGNFTCGFIYWFPKTPCDPPHNYDDIFSFHGNYYTPNGYSIKKNDVKKLQNLFQEYSKNLNNKDFPHSAIFYLDKGVKRNEPTDSLVDFTAALEYLLVKGKQEITFTLKIYTASFLKGYQQNGREISEDIKKAYDFRSKIVHGRSYKVDEFKCMEISKKIEGYARKAIIKWLDMIDKGKTAKEIYDSIEKKLLS